jgi:hypothetical protein
VLASRPDDLIGLVPYLLGFVPEESLVLMVVRDGRVLVTARLDLPPVHLAQQVSEQLLAIASQTQAAGLVLLAYSAEAEPARAMLESQVDPLQPAGLIDALYVGPTRWWSLLCRSGCCPSDGVAYDISSHPLAAEAVFAGLTAASGRAEIEQRVSGPPEGDLEQLERVNHTVGAQLVDLTPRQAGERMLALVQRHLDGSGVSDADCARLAILAADVIVRDLAWAAMDRDHIEDHLSLWSQVVARAIAPWQPAPLCLLGMAAWIAGNGALQNCCADRVLAIDPGYSMAGLLAEINARMLPPSTWDGLARELRAELAARS